MKAEDPAPLEDDVTLRLRRYPSCHLDGDEPSDWSIRLNLSPSGATISGSRQMPACDRKHPGLIERHRFRVSHAWAKALKLRLAAVRIPAMPNFVIGCDGEYRELVYEGIGGRAEYRWWSCPPDGWGAMNELYRDLYALFDAMASIRSAAPDRCSPHVRLYCTVAGTSHVAGIRQLTQDLEIGSSLMLERDYGNRCDSHAIAVLTEDGDRIGFIPKEQNRLLAELMADEAVFSAVVAGIKDRNKYREIKIHVIEHPRSIFRAAGA